ncbi:MAG: alanine racemase [Deltaproteobacteria bacterium]|nr:alanine racemase [Deltaproteobacteria bacterium]
MAARDLLAAITNERLPALVLDLGAFDRNLERQRTLAKDRALPLRVATKSLRAPTLIARTLTKGGGDLKGLLCFAIGEAEGLFARGLDDLFVAYPPSIRRGKEQDLARAARLARKGCTLVLSVDSREAIDRAAEEARLAETELSLALCIDMSLELAGGRVHLGVRRSPLREPDEIVALAKHVASTPGLRFAGLLCYEAQVAGLPDRSPFAPLENPIKQLIRRRSIDDVAKRRCAIVDALVSAGLAPSIVNGGGTGSLDSTTRQSGVTETTAGSGFFKPHLFDYFHDAHMRALEPALFLALEVTRIPGPGWATVNGGGYVASGSAGKDKLPLPVWPEGVTLDDMEGAGEVQTPLRVPKGASLAIGDVVLFRHAKAGEPCERFPEILVVEGGHVVERAPTYRGLGWSFF